MDVQKKVEEERQQTEHQVHQDQNTQSIGLAYIRGLSEKLTPLFKQHWIGTFH